MISMIKKLIVVSLLCIVISCAFSTRGGNVKQVTKIQAGPVIKIAQDTVIKYVERAPLTKEQQARRDSILKNYIGTIIKPYTEDLKTSNATNILNLTGFIQSQGNRLDSINGLRHKEIHDYNVAQAQRDSFLLQSILKDRRIDSLQTAVVRIEKTNIDANKIANGINDLIVIIRDLAIYAILVLALVLVGLTLFLEWIKNKKRKELKLSKQDE